MNEELVYDLADLFKIFSDSTRVKVLCSLFEKELNVTEITAATGVSQTAVSHQLRILKQNHLVKYPITSRIPPQITLKANSPLLTSPPCS